MPRNLWQHRGNKGCLQKAFIGPEFAKKCELRKYCATRVCIAHITDSEHRDIQYSTHYRYYHFLIPNITTALFITLHFRISLLIMPIAQSSVDESDRPVAKRVSRF